MNGDKYSILLVEDNPDHLSFEKNSIEKLQGVSEVITACSAKEAKEKLNTAEVDLIVLDYQLPDSDGLAFLEYLMEANSGYPVVMVTGLGNEKVAVKAMQLGAYDYVVKERDYLKTLPEVIRRTIDKIKLHRSLRLVEAKLRESEDRYQKLFENANSGFVSVNMKTSKYIKPNKKTLEMTGYSIEELERMHCCELVAPEDQERISSYHKASLYGKLGTSESPFEFEFWMLTKNGTKKYVRCTVTMFPQIDEIFMTLNDITDRKELEEKLKEAHEQLKRYAKELEEEVDDLKKRLIIEPALEKLTDTEQKYSLLDFGVCYLVKEKEPTKSYDIFKDFVSHGTFGLCITRTHPMRIQRLFQLERTPIVWLSKSEWEGGSISGSNLGGLAHAIADFIEKSQKSIVILDGLEYLITVNGFDVTIRYLNDIIENVMKSESILLIPVHVEALENRHMAILERLTETTNVLLD